MSPITYSWLSLLAAKALLVFEAFGLLELFVLKERDSGETEGGPGKLSPDAILHRGDESLKASSVFVRLSEQW